MAALKKTGQNENNNKMEAAIMTVQSNIQSIIKNKAQILARLFAGGTMAVTFMLPGNASADNPTRPVGQVESSVLIPTSNLANVTDMDFLDPGFYDAKFVRTSTGHGFDLDLLDPGVYDAKLARVSSVWESGGVDPYENVASKVIRTNSGMDMDLLDPGFYNTTTRSWESDGVDLYENVAKVIRTNSGMDMGLLDPGFYNAKLVNSSRNIEGLQEDNII